MSESRVTRRQAVAQGATAALVVGFAADARSAHAAPLVAGSTWINVKDYGAVGDGVTDDTSAIQAAINACPTVPHPGGNAKAETVYFPPGKYVVSSLTMPNSQTFSGSGAGSSGTAYGNFITLMGSGGLWGGSWLVRKGGTDNVLVDLSGTLAAGPTILRSVGPRIENLVISGNNGTKPLVRCYYAGDVGFRAVRLEANLGPAIEGVEWQDSRLDQVWFNNVGGTSGVTSNDGSTNGTEALRILGQADGNPSNTTFGWTNDNCNNLYFNGCIFTNSGAVGQIALSYNKSANGGALAPHRIYFINGKIELGSMRGDPVKILGKWSRAQWIYFVNHDFTGYSLASGASPVTWINADTAYSCSLRNVLFDDALTTGVTHAPIKLTDSEFWTIEDVCTNIGTAAGGDTTAAALIHCGFSNGKPLEIGNVRLQGRTTPWFSGSTITDRRRSPRGATSTQTPGAVSTVTIAHGLGYTPQEFAVQPGNVAARGAPAFYLTADATNVTLSFASNLTAATQYVWQWHAG